MTKGDDHMTAHCAIAECDRTVKASGYCGAHYHRLRRYGDPLGSKSRTKPFRACGANGCDLGVIARGYCPIHYASHRRHGDPLAASRRVSRPRMTTPDGMKWCPQCKSYQSRNDFNRNRTNGDGLASVCGQCARAKNRRYQQENPTIYRTHASSRRTRLAGVARERFKKIEIFDRDKWICQLCGKRIDRALKWPDPMSVTLDHIIPIADRGPDTRANVQAAHARCNISKKRGARNEQLRLVG